MTRADIVKEMGPCLGVITDVGHVADTILSERRFQASKRKFRLVTQEESFRKKIKSAGLQLR